MPVARLRVLAVLLSIAFVPAGAARGVVIDTLTGSGNTSAPIGDPGWTNVGVIGNGTGVYLGDGWVLTTVGVGGGAIILDGVAYPMVVGSGTTLGNNGTPGVTTATDLFMFQIATPPAGLPSLPIASARPTVGDPVIMIGAGRDRGAFKEWSVDTQTNPWTWVEVESGGDAAGYATLSSRSMRWGTNTVNDAGTWFHDGASDTLTIDTVFTASGSPSTEAQAVAGDVGGAIFWRNGSTWELAGLVLAVAGYSGQPDPLLNAVYGDTTLAADLSFYRSQIVAVVPEPSSIALLGMGIATLVIERRRRRLARCV
jgi:hypothetical protein